MKSGRALLTLLLSLPAGCRPTVAGPVGEAHRFFDRYVELERTYDPRLVDLYADSALIKKERRLPDGGVQRGSLSGAEFKALLRRWRPGAADREARNTYSDVSYHDLGNGYVRIEMRRRQLPKNWTSDQEFIVGPGPAGHWVIWEESAEAPPLAN